MGINCMEMKIQISILAISKGTPYPHLQFMALGISLPQIS